MPEKVIQFGEGNFLRAFVDWIIWNMDQKTDFNGSVVVAGDVVIAGALRTVFLLRQGVLFEK